MTFGYIIVVWPSFKLLKLFTGQEKSNELFRLPVFVFIVTVIFFHVHTGLFELMF